MTALTRDSLKGCRLEFTAHLDGSGWYGEAHRCVEHPRLGRITRFARRRGALPKDLAPLTWTVDGKRVADLDEAVAKLNEPPVLTDEEKAALEKVGDEYVDLRKQVEFRLLNALTDKGMIEFRDGKCRRRKEGRAR